MTLTHAKVTWKRWSEYKIRCERATQYAKVIIIIKKSVIFQSAITKSAVKGEGDKCQSIKE
jgi:hypothetical protein